MSEVTPEETPDAPAPPAPASPWRRRLRRLGALVLLGVLCLLALVLYLARAEDPPAFDEQAAQRVKLVGWQQLLPGAGIPADLPLQAANNNCDAALHEGRTYLSVRSGPHHFASDRTQLFVLSSADRVRWELEHTFDLPGGDLREPRFFSYQGRLLFYFFKAGTDPLAFEPRSIYVSERRGPGEWSEPRAIFRPGFVVWRIREHAGRAYMSVYRGAGLYTTSERPGEVRLLVSSDGLEWAPISTEPQVSRVGASECDFVFDPEGGLVALVRLEVQGSLVCTARPGRLDEWEQTYSPHKYDSPLLLQQGGEVYAVARRNVAGAFYRGPDAAPAALRRGWSLARYSLTRKRTCLYRLDLERRAPTPIFDLPSRGDTAFAGAVRLGPDRWWLVNYSSPLEGADLPWLAGQVGRTHLYAGELVFEAGE